MVLTVACFWPRRVVVFLLQAFFLNLCLCRRSQITTVHHEEFNSFFKIFKSSVDHNATLN